MGRLVQRAGWLLAVAMLLGAPWSVITAQTGAVQGKVTDSTGAAIVGAILMVEGTGVRGASGANGRYSLGGVPAGSRVVRARALGFAAQSIPVTVTAGRPTTLDITLVRSPQQLAPVSVVVGSRANDDHDHREGQSQQQCQPGYGLHEASRVAARLLPGSMATLSH